MSLRALLDINLLVALFDPDHVHHDAAHGWFEDHRASGWATCPVTENGLVRVVCQAAAGESFARPMQLVERLRAFRASGDHEFWPDAVSLTDKTLFNPSLIRGHRQLTDIYLLGLAFKMGGCLVTFDSSIPRESVRGIRRETLQVISQSS